MVEHAGLPGPAACANAMMLLRIFANSRPQLRVRMCLGMFAAGITFSVLGQADSMTPDSTSNMRVILWGARALSIAAIEHERIRPTSARPPRNFANITDISEHSGHVDVVALDGGLQSAPEFSLYQWQLASNAAVLKAAIRGLVSAQTSADGQLGALVICHSEGCNVEVRRLSTGDQLAQWPRMVARTAKVSWIVDGKSILFDGEDGWIKTATVADHVVANLARGRAPAVSPGGTQVAYVSDKEIRVRSLDSGQDRRVYSSSFLSQGFVGRLHWSIDGREIIANREAGSLGYDTECLVIDASSGRANSFRNGGLWCGPWVPIPNR
jgi:hypothetical protein